MLPWVAQAAPAERAKRESTEAMGVTVAMPTVAERLYPDHW
jgi:hypothetical protein